MAGGSGNQGFAGVGAGPMGEDERGESAPRQMGSVTAQRVTYNEPQSPRFLQGLRDPRGVGVPQVRSSRGP